MDTKHGIFRDAGERLSALALALAATFLVFAAINAGFTPHGAALAGRNFSQQGLAPSAGLGVRSDALLSRRSGAA